MDDSVAVAAIGGVDIANIMTSCGPIVNAVILRCPPLSKETEEDSKPAAVPTAATTTEKKNGNDDKSSSAAVTAASTAIRPKRVVLTDLIEEVKTDTTPSKSKIAEVLGGPFTFLGQYEDEGIVLMVRKLPDDLEEILEDIHNNEEEEEADDDDDDDDDDKNNNKNGSKKSPTNKQSFSFPKQLSKNFNVKALKAVCIQREIDTEGMIEKSDLIKALLDYQSHLPPYNTHQLQPPLHKARVRGDIVILKVAETKEELEGDSKEEEENNNDKSKVGNDIDDGNEKEKINDVDDKNQNNEKTITKVSEIKINNEVETKTKEVRTYDIKNDKDEDKEDDDGETKKVIVPTNDEFFLDYSKSEYVTFASRTDIPEHEIEIPKDDDEEEDENDDAVDTDEGRDGDGEAFLIGEDEDDEEIDETDKSAMFNLVMNEVLRQYREENGRGPNTKELLELRANIAKELGVEIAQEIDGDWDKKANANSVPSAKKIAFDPEKDTVKEYVPDANEYLSDNDKDAISRSLMGDYEEDDNDEDDEDYAEEPPTKRPKTSEEDEKSESKPSSK